MNTKKISDGPVCTSLNQVRPQKMTTGKDATCMHPSYGSNGYFFKSTNFFIYYFSVHLNMHETE